MGHCGPSLFGLHSAIEVERHHRCQPKWKNAHLTG